MSKNVVKGEFQFAFFVKGPHYQNEICAHMGAVRPYGHLDPGTPRPYGRSLYKMGAQILSLCPWKNNAHQLKSTVSMCAIVEK